MHYVLQQRPDSPSLVAGRKKNATTGDLADESSRKCILCGDSNTQKSTYNSWGELEHMYLVHHFNFAPQKGSMICEEHLLEAKRNSQSLNHIPIWKRNDKGPSILYRYMH